MSRFASLSYFDLAELFRKSMFSITKRTHSQNKPIGTYHKYERPVVTSHFTVHTSYFTLHTSQLIVSYVNRCMEDNGKCQFKVHTSYFTVHGSDFRLNTS